MALAGWLYTLIIRRMVRDAASLVNRVGLRLTEDKWPIPEPWPVWHPNIGVHGPIWPASGRRGLLTPAWMQVSADLY